MRLPFRAFSVVGGAVLSILRQPVRTIDVGNRNWAGSFRNLGACLPSLIELKTGRETREHVGGIQLRLGMPFFETSSPSVVPGKVSLSLDHFKHVRSLEHRALVNLTNGNDVEIPSRVHTFEQLVRTAGVLIAGLKEDFISRLASDWHPEALTLAVESHLNSVWGTVGGSLLCSLVERNSLPPPLTLAVVKWAFAQPAWCHDPRTFSRLITHFAGLGNREGASDMADAALSSGCLLNSKFLNSSVFNFNRLKEYKISTKLCSETLARGVGFETGAGWGQGLMAFNAEMDMDGAMKVWQLMKDMGVKIEYQHFTVMITLCGRTGRKDLLSRLSKELKATGVEPTEILYSRLMEAHCEVGDTKSARQSFVEMKDRGIETGWNAYSALLATLRLECCKDEAEFVIEQMKAAPGFSVGGELYGVVLHHYAEYGDCTKLLELHETMLQRGASLSAKMYGVVFGALWHRKGPLRSDAYLQLLFKVLELGTIDLVPSVYDKGITILRFRGRNEDADALHASRVGRFGEDQRRTCKELLEAKDWLSLKQKLRQLLQQNRTLFMTTYNFMLHRGNNSEPLMSVLGDIGYKPHELTQLMLNEGLSEQEVWCRAQHTFSPEHKNWRFLDGLVCIMVSRGFHLRARRLWEEIKARNLSLPEMRPIRKINKHLRLDLFKCNVETAIVIACVELKSIVDWEESDWASVSIGLGSGCTTRREGVLAMLATLDSPFRCSNIAWLRAPRNELLKWAKRSHVQKGLEQFGHVEAINVPIL